MSPALRPFFLYFGGKWRSAKHYPTPTHDLIIEPFAGAAGYSTVHHTKQVVLVEKNPQIAALWRWLITTPAEEIRALPLIEPMQRIDELGVCAEAATLIGMALNPGGSSPKASRGKDWPGAKYDTQHRMNSWTSAFRDRVASQVEHIRHWQVFEGSYAQVPNIPATWFVDPPYQSQGRHYPNGSADIDFAHLGAWCRERTGQTIVCEAQGADWLPFKPIAARIKCVSNKTRSGRKYSAEAVWTNE